MAWYPNANKMELQPESDDQPAIRPTQLIFHSIAAPWTPRRTYEYWRDSTNLESHFGVGYDGSIAQYIGTETRADANYLANRRGDGTGAVSVETASNDDASDEWTDEQVSTLIRLGVWMHEYHGIPLRACRWASDPGFGYHRMHDEWSDGGTDCPGDERVRQFRDVIFPGIVRAANGEPTPGPAPEPDEPAGAVEIDGKRYGPGAEGDHITAMGRALVRADCSRYRVGPGPEWTSADTESFRAWQQRLGDDPENCDGIPGPLQLARLMREFGDEHTHTVSAGETLSGIARTYGTTWQTLAEINGIEDANQITPGQTLTLP